MHPIVLPTEWCLHLLLPPALVWLRSRTLGGINWTSPTGVLPVNLLTWKVIVATWACRETKRIGKSAEPGALSLLLSELKHHLCGTVASPGLKPATMYTMETGGSPQLRSPLGYVHSSQQTTKGEQDWCTLSMTSLDTSSLWAPKPRANSDMGGTRDKMVWGKAFL
jgi:hypothetical protein